ncbi:ATP-grasp domain-containing protein [Candidatus Saccharibacteria bacterium]|nr:ATP-grasp domain-containing protein [Candidatus Saccharibacteria bacterium]
MKQLLVVYDNPQGLTIDYDQHIKSMETELGKDYKVGRTALINLEFWVKKNSLIVKTAKGLDLKKVDSVFFAKWQMYQNAFATAAYLNKHQVAFKPKQVANFPPTNKLGETASLADNDLLIPNSLITSVENIKGKASRYLAFFEPPVVLKNIESSLGNDNFLIRSEKELLQKLSRYRNRDIFMVQEFIPNKGDYRCLVFNGRAKVLLKRTRANNLTHLNNTNKGAKGEIIAPIPPELKKMAEQAAKLTGRQDFAGVDIIIHQQTKKPYVLEVNRMPVVFHGNPKRPEKTAAEAAFLRSI